MAKNTAISIRLDSQLKEQTEKILAQFGLNMTTVVNMLFHQIVREREIPLSLTLNPKFDALNELKLAKADRTAGIQGRDASSVMEDMERIVTETENATKEV